MTDYLKMANLNKNSAVLAALMSIFVVFNIHVPHILAQLIDTLLGRVAVIIGALSLLFTHPVLGVLGVVVAYELIRRSENTTGSGPAKKYLPSEAKKSKELNALNQFEVSVEEEIIAKMLPRASPNLISKASYKPVLNSLHEAAKI